MSVKARVFISCGQRKTATLSKVTRENCSLFTPEFEIAQEISDELTNLGYDPYVALEQQKLEGVKEAIFQRLQESEYFIFIDFRREQLGEEGTIDFVWNKEYRGSLFSHQELAIATFQGLNVLAFQEDGVKKFDGILKFIQANCTPFSDRKKLAKLVISKVKEKWENNWQNELSMNRDIFDFQNAVNGGITGRYFHIKVFNNHKDRVARNCIGYVEKIKDRSTGKTRTLELVELKWKGVNTVGVSIPPKSFRYLDAFNISLLRPTTANLGLNLFITDWEGYLKEYQIDGSGDYELNYVIFSDNFSPVRTKFRLQIDEDGREVKFTKMN